MYTLYEQRYSSLINELDSNALSLLNEVKNNLKKVAQGKAISKKQSKQSMDSSREVLKEWLLKNRNNPYPSEEEKAMLAEKAGLTKTQVDNCKTSNNKKPTSNSIGFVNGRKRYLEDGKTQPPQVRRKVELKNELITRFTNDAKGI